MTVTRKKLRKIIWQRKNQYYRDVLDTHKDDRQKYKSCYH